LVLAFKTAIPSLARSVVAANPATSVSPDSVSKPSLLSSQFGRDSSQLGRLAQQPEKATITRHEAISILAECLLTCCADLIGGLQISLAYGKLA